MKIRRCIPGARRFFTLSARRCCRFRKVHLRTMPSVDGASLCQAAVLWRLKKPSTRPCHEYHYVLIEKKHSALKNVCTTPVYVEMGNGPAYVLHGVIGERLL